MVNVDNLVTIFEGLNNYEQQIFYSIIQEKHMLNINSAELSTTIKENRFSQGKVCPHCKSEDVSRNGKYKNRQRYIWKLCKKTFTDFTLSPCYNSKKETRQWLEYVKCMIAGSSIRKSAKIVGISIPTSFYWRHKILDALRVYLGVGSVSGVVEADETMFRISYKGNHSKNPNFTMPRKAFKRGPKSLPSPNEPKRKRGVSNQRVSVMCALDRSGNIISELLCNRRMKYIDADRLFKDRIEDKSTLCVDSHKSYIKLSDNFDVDLQQIESGKYKKGIYHIQHINAYHSRLKGFMKKFNGVWTKHLCGYMYWFKWLELFKEDRDEVKYHKLFVQSHSVYSSTKLKDFKVKQPIYI